MEQTLDSLFVRLNCLLKIHTHSDYSFFNHQDQLPLALETIDQLIQQKLDTYGDLLELNESSHANPVITTSPLRQTIDMQELNDLKNANNDNIQRLTEISSSTSATIKNIQTLRGELQQILNRKKELRRKHEDILHQQTLVLAKQEKTRREVRERTAKCIASLESQKRLKQNLQRENQRIQSMKAELEQLNANIKNKMQDITKLQSIAAEMQDICRKQSVGQSRKSSIQKSEQGASTFRSSRASHSSQKISLGASSRIRC